MPATILIFYYSIYVELSRSIYLLIERRNIELAKKKKKVNTDQRSKSVNGNKNNTVFSKESAQWADDKNRLNLFKEHMNVLITLRGEGVFECPYTDKFDQTIAAVVETKKTVLVVCVDNTTSYRERVSGKTNEGVMMEKTKQSLTNEILNKYPNLIGYHFVFLCAVIFPDKLEKVSNPEKEIKEIDKFLVGVNYKLSGRHITDEFKNGIDCAMRSKDLFDLLDEIIENPDDYIMDKLVLAYAWIKKYDGVERYRPSLPLNEHNAFYCRDLLIWSLNNDESKYYRVNKNQDDNNKSKKKKKKKNKREKKKPVVENEDDYIDSLRDFLIAHDCPYNAEDSFTTKKSNVIEHLLKVFPAQESMSLLPYIEKEFDHIRSAWNRNNDALKSLEKLKSVLSDEQLEALKNDLSVIADVLNNN